MHARRYLLLALPLSISLVAAAQADDLRRLPPVAAQVVQHLEPVDYFADDDDGLLPPTEELAAPPLLGDAVEWEPEADSLTVDELPVYNWYDIRYWLPRDGWEASVELGLNGTAGNTETLAQRAGADLKIVRGLNIWTLNAIYNRATAGNLETANNAFGTARYDRELGDSPWSLFFDNLIEYDEFRAFDLRLATNGGLGYAFIQTERTTLKGRFGSGVSREFGGPDDRTVPEAVFGGDFEHQLTAKQKLSITTDFYPDWTDFSQYRINTNAGWELLIDQEMNLSLKAAVLNRYDSTPHGLRPNDLNYSLLLLWRL